MWRILVADDHLVDRRLIKQFLKGKAECHEAADGNETILSYNFSIHEKMPYDVILMDIAMPKMEGAEVLRRIREDEKKRNVPPAQRVPAIAVSALPESEIKIGPDTFCAFVGKPMDPKDLLEKIEKAVSKPRF